MAFFTMPSLGSDMEDGTLLSWNVAPGDRVAKGDVVAVVDTEKAALDVEIFFDGVVEELLVEPGTKVPVGAPLARVRRDDEHEDRGEEPEPETAQRIASLPGASTQPAPEPIPSGPTTEPSLTTMSAGARKRVSPAARKRARELCVDVMAVVGTGPRGAVTIADVERAATVPGAEEESVEDRSARLRAAIATRMAKANREIPHYYLETTIDLEPALRWLEERNAQRSVEERVLPAALLLAATARALTKVPELNGWWRDDAFEAAEEVDLGVAVALKGGGTMVPVIRGADAMSLETLMVKLTEVVTRARDHHLATDDLCVASCTVTSLGDRAPEKVFGVIFPPQVALVGFGAIVTRPWVVDGEVVPRRVVTVTLAADHRASDGHRGGRMLQALGRLLAAPEKL